MWAQSCQVLLSFLEVQDHQHLHGHDIYKIIYKTQKKKLFIQTEPQSLYMLMIHSFISVFEAVLFGYLALRVVLGGLEDLVYPHLNNNNPVSSL